MAEAGARELVLASASPFRRKMLSAAGLSFRVVPAEVDEAALKRGFVDKTPAEIAGALARAKALEVSARLPAARVIGADQVLALGTEMFDKPGDLAAARAQLLRLRGKTHKLLTAAALAESGEIVWSRLETATLTMRSFSAAFVDSYLAAAGAGLCRIVGAYEIEGAGIQLFERVEGDHFTIVGLPLLALLTELRARGGIAT